MDLRKEHVKNLGVCLSARLAQKSIVNIWWNFVAPRNRFLSIVDLRGLNLNVNKVTLRYNLQEDTMRSYIYIVNCFIALLLTFFVGSVFAQELGEPSAQELMNFLAALGGIKGASSLAIAALAVQGLMLLFRSSVGNFIGKYKLLTVLGLSLVSGILALKLNGVDIGAALVHSTTMASFQVFLNQLYKQFFEKKD